MINIAGTSGETDKENYSDVLASSKKKQHMGKEKVQGKITFNIETLSEFDQQRLL